ncbi:MAG: acetylglutamate kinase [Deltaproteobacteria bacterium]|nr:acetylglutamate kinase [Deltaproteobacteria bacterium]
MNEKAGNKNKTQQTRTAAELQGKSSARKAILIEALSYIGKFRGKVVLVKYGGAAQIRDDLKKGFAQDMVLLHSLGMLPVIVHGGGPEVNRAIKAMGGEPVFIDGQRVTTSESLAIAEMVLSGSVNKDLVALLNSNGAKAVGISGKDGNLIRAKKLVRRDGLDLGHVGEVDHVEPEVVRLLLDNGHIPVISPIAMDEGGNTLNVNADSVAARIASAMKAEKIIFMTDVDGVMDEGRRISNINADGALKLINDGVITGGMVPKVDAMIHCLRSGVGSAQIINGSEEHSIIAELFTDEGIGTKIVP